MAYTGFTFCKAKALQMGMKITICLRVVTVQHLYKTHVPGGGAPEAINIAKQRRSAFGIHTPEGTSCAVSLQHFNSSLPCEAAASGSTRTLAQLHPRVGFLSEQPSFPLFPAPKHHPSYH